MIRRPADNIVLDFMELNEMKRRIKVVSTEDEDRFKVIRGLSARNQIVDVSYMTGNELKQLWIDSVVNGFECVKNEIFMRGIKDCFPEPDPTKDASMREIENFEKVKDIIYSA
jgi:hypothetical protein